MTALAEGALGGMTASEVAMAISDEDAARAQFYRLIGSLLSAPPSQTMLDACARLDGGDGELGDVVGVFARVAGSARAEAVRSEYLDLFIGLTRGELVPYGSYYLTGFLQEKPLARLRSDMATLGIARNDRQADPEDHVASVLEMMAGLIEGRFGTGTGADSAEISMTEQKQFFARHIQSWMPVFFRDLQAAKSSVFYSALGAVGHTFLAIEVEAFEMV